MKLIDIATRNTKELEALKKKVIALVKKAGCNTGEIRWSNTGKVQYCEVENDGKLGDYLSDIIKKSAYAQNIIVKEYEGDYMWEPDRYIRPVSIVTFTF